MPRLNTIEGVGDDIAGKLRKAGIGSTEKLLSMCAERASRDRIARDAGIDPKRLLRFVNHADLMRIKGVGGEFSELLEAAGVDSVPELARRNAANLAEELRKVNLRKKVARRVPTEKVLRNWIAQAKKLGSAVMH